MAEFIINNEDEREKQLKALAELQTEALIRLGLPKQSAQDTSPVLSSQEQEVNLDEEAQELLVQDVGYMAWPFVQATMPHSKLKLVDGHEQNEFERKNGDFFISMQSPRRIGLPYGGKPRLILAWVTTRAVLTKSPVVELGRSQNDFIRNLNVGSRGTGGETGNIRSLKDQTRRLLSCHITCFNTGAGEDGFTMQSVKPVTSAQLYWWGAKDPDQQCLWESHLTLGQDYFDAITNSPVPINLNALRELQNSPLAMDIYCWLTYRNSYAKGGSRIPWVALQKQFGVGYPMTSRGKADFKRKFLLALKKVIEAYRMAGRFEIETDHLVYYPGKPDIFPGKIILP